MASSEIKPFEIAVPEEKITLLKKKLELAEFPDELDNSDWDLGVPLSLMKRLVEYWKTSYDWRAAERKFNQIPQFITTIEVDNFGSLEIHFLHIKSTVDGAIPLCFVHGWPGSFMEAEKIIHDLANPAGKGPAFDVVVPSLPGFGFSDYPTKIGFGLPQYSEVCNKLMLKLGYNEYVTQGGDWGYHITRTMGFEYAPKYIKAQHLNNVLNSVPPRITSNPILWLQHQLSPYSEREKKGIERTQWFMTEGRGYNVLQGTKPQTLGYALVDSPVALLAWILEKLHDWTDSYPWTDEEIITWVSIYLFSKAGPTSSVRIYYMSTHQPEYRLRNAEYNGKVPLGISIFPRDLSIPPVVQSRTQGNIVFEKYHESGGHFAAHEKPRELVEDLRTMFGKGGGAYGVVKGRKGYSRQTAML